VEPPASEDFTVAAVFMAGVVGAGDYDREVSITLSRETERRVCRERTT
jgi:hypothetical protein